MNKPMVFAILGALLVVAGAFTPIASYPTGDVTLIHWGPNESYILFGLAGLALILAVARKRKLLWICGVGSIGVMVYTFLKLQQGMNAAIQSGADSLAASGQTGSIAYGFKWGWAVLLVGAVLLTSAGAMSDE